MERAILMRLALSSLLFLTAVLAAGNGLGQDSPTRRMLLVNAMDSPIKSVSIEELRRAYLSMTVYIGNVNLRPLLNDSDARLTQVFLQKVIFMSRKRYERQVAAQIFRQGGRRPPAIDNTEDIVQHLLASPDTITFMWSDEFDKMEGLKSLGVIWEGDNP